MYIPHPPPLYMYITHPPIYVHTSSSSSDSSSLSYMDAYVCMCMYVCMCIPRISTYTCMYVCMCIHIYIYVYEKKYVHTSSSSSSDSSSSSSLSSLSSITTGRRLFGLAACVFSFFPPLSADLAPFLCCPACSQDDASSCGLLRIKALLTMKALLRLLQYAPRTRTRPLIEP
jgi:hypothetical protein